MLTFEDQCKMYQRKSGDYSPEGLITGKQQINEGGTVFLNRIGRKYNKEYIKRNLTASKQYYQFPMGMIRPSEFRFLNGTNYDTATLITDEEEWNRINTTSISGNYIEYYYIRGSKEVGVYPIPSSNVTNGISVSVEPQHIQLTEFDFDDGTITVNNGQIAITHSASGFTQNMVGRWFTVNDGSDGRWYRIASFVSTSVLNLENYYEGISGSGRTFRIGQVMKIPPGYQDAPVFWALIDFYDEQNDEQKADKYELKFNRRIKSAKETYARSTSRLGTKVSNNRRRLRWIDLTPPVQYP